MNLPLVLDIAIGLIFIYLILSLLTCEIQELITILLQWRAEHLKRSIENLLEGESIDDPLYEKFTDELYNSPLITALNQEARGFFALLFRKVAQAITWFSHAITGTQSVFGKQKSGPSYIPSDTFSAALLQKINLEELSHHIGELAARKFAKEKLTLLKNILNDLRNSLGDHSLLENELHTLQHSLEEILEDLVGGRNTLSGCIDELSEQLLQFVSNTEALLSDNHHCEEIIRKRLPYVKQMIARKQLEPTVSEVLRLIFADDRHHTVKLSPWLIEIVRQLNKENPELLQKVTNIPEQLQRSLLSLAEQARIKTKNLEEEVQQLQQEVATWFDNSMQRASGVYKRNAKGIALLLGFLVAVLINADTLHIVNRLANDTLLRSTISQAADQVVARSKPSGAAIAPNPDAILPATPTNSPVPSGTIQTDLEEVRDAVNNVLDELPLPVGWDATNVKQQEEDSKGWSVPILQRIIGWIITGVALSMGANFWYETLNRFIRFRSTGSKPDTDQ
jgi:hypothetical protein